MWITNRTSVSFDPNTEFEAIKAFVETNDMREWIEYSTTAGVTFVCTKTFFTGAKKEDERG